LNGSNFYHKSLPQAANDEKVCTLLSCTNGGSCRGYVAAARGSPCGRPADNKVIGVKYAGLLTVHNTHRTF